MPRPKEFDPDDILEQAMELFWEQGYEATSAQDLVDYTGLNRSSLYNTFGNKRKLYLATLDRYCRQGIDTLTALLEESDSTLEALRHVFRDVAEDPKRRGCFMANAAVEQARCNEETWRRTRENLAQMQDMFQNAVVCGQAQGEIPTEKDARALGHFLTNTYYGMRTLAKVGPPREVLDDAAEVALQALE